MRPRRQLARGMAYTFFGLTTFAFACGDDDSSEKDAGIDGPASSVDASALDAIVDSRPDAAAADYDASPEPVACTVTPCAVELAAGQGHICALISDGTVRCWGDDTRGALGHGDRDATRSGPGPVEVAGITGAMQISAADRVTCARRMDGSVSCWGANDKAQLGLSASEPLADDAPHPTPTKVALTASAVRIDVGHDSACAALASGTLWCWGANHKYQLLRPQAGDFGGPGPATPQGLRLTQVTFGGVTGYGIADDGRLVTWGEVSGERTSFPADPEPRVLSSLEGAIDVATSSWQAGYFGTFTFHKVFHTCVIASGRVYCWGGAAPNEALALCNGVPSAQQVPVVAELQGQGHPQQIAVGRETTCVRLTDGTVECCGDDSRGQVGTGHVAEKPSVLNFTKASALEGHAVSVVTSDDATCALIRDGSVMCWGGNAHGELGQGTTDALPHPIPVKVRF